MDTNAREMDTIQFKVIGVGAAAAEAAMAAPLFARNNVSSMASEVAEPPHFLLPY